MNNNILLILIISSYLYPLYFIFKSYNKNKSISSIVCDIKCRKMISKYMFLMCIFLFFYELNRQKNDNLFFSLISIIGIIVSINIVISTSEQSITHCIAASTCILFMLLFMYINLKNNLYLKFLFRLQLIFLLILYFDLINKNKIFISESLIFTTFGIYFFLLHCIEINLL